MTETMSLRARSSAPLAAVRRALTDEVAMRAWLAEHAESDLPRRYAFWGPSVPEGDAPRQHPLGADDTSLRFAWTLDGVETTVTITLATEADDTVITLVQDGAVDFAAMVAGAGSRAIAQTWWSLTIANLVDHVDGRPLTPRPDLSATRHRAEVTIHAPRERVYAALTDAAQFERWFGAHVGIEPEVGGRFAMGGFDRDPEPARFVELDPGRGLTLRWPGGLVTAWELAGSGGATRLVVTQHGFGDDPDHGAWLGWVSGVAELRRYLEIPGWRQTWLAAEVTGMPEGILAL